MKIPVFPAALAAVVVGGVAVGWMAAGPPAPSRPAAARPAPAQSAPDPSADAAGRQSLRQAVLSAAAALRGNPCNGQAKLQFFSAVQAYIRAYHRDAGQSALEPPQWRTSGDDQVRAILRDLPDDGVVDGAELARTITAAEGQRAADPAVPELPAAPTSACLRYQSSLAGS